MKKKKYNYHEKKKIWYRTWVGYCPSELKAGLGTGCWACWRWARRHGAGGMGARARGARARGARALGRHVMDLVSQLSSRAALRQLAPRMLLSQPPARLASYARLLPPAWKQRELKRTLGERNSLLKEELFTMLMRSSQT